MSTRGKEIPGKPASAPSQTGVVCWKVVGEVQIVTCGSRAMGAATRGRVPGTHEMDERFPAHGWRLRG